MNVNTFIDKVFTIAQKHGYVIEIGRSGLRQVDFGNKKLHEEHLRELFPKILQDGKHIPTLINSVAPGRPCTHKPMRIIINEMQQ